MTLKNRVLKKSLTGHGEEDDILDVTERPNVIRPLGAVLGRYLPRRERNFLFLLGGNSFFEPEGEQPIGRECERSELWGSNTRYFERFSVAAASRTLRTTVRAWTDR